MAKADVGDASNLLFKMKSRLRTLYKEPYTMCSVVKLIDAMAGNEPEDYTAGKCVHIHMVRDLLHKDADERLNKQDSSSSDPASLMELIALVTSKWKIIEDRNQEKIV